MSTDQIHGAYDRQQEILRRALLRRVVRVKDLAAEYGVHEMTIRRDLDLLAENGQLERIHGGARLNERASEELSQQLRAPHHGTAKEAIALRALELVNEGDTVALDASTTSLALARLLGGRKVQAIVTSLDAAEALAALGVPFVLAGGTFHPPARSFVGATVQTTLDRLNPDKAFFSAKGFDPDTGFCDPHLPEVEVKRSLLRGAGTVVALLDHSKFGCRSLAQIVHVDRVDVVVTDREPSAEDRDAFASNDVRLLVGSSRGG